MASHSDHSASSSVLYDASPEFVVGIGASAGGLDALRAVVGNIAADTGICFLIAQHMSPKHRSLLTELLEKCSVIAVRDACDGQVLEADTIFVCPPGSDVTIENGLLHLSDASRSSQPQPSVDHLFQSMSETYSERCAGIVLSGTGSDGALGCRAIRTNGGLVVAQDPDTAQYESMPTAAMSVGGAEYTLPPSDIGERILELMRLPRGNPPEISKQLEASDDDIQTLLEAIYKRKRLDFSGYKAPTLCRQIGRRMASLQISSLDDYRDFSLKHPEELDALAKSFLISVSAFFRDGKAFEMMADELSKLIETKRNHDSLRLWVAGCATGEEVYSMAILIRELCELADVHLDVKIYGTDIDEDALQYARRGIYTRAAVRGISDARLSRYFRVVSDGYEVTREIRDLVMFARQDLVMDPPFLRLDMVSCRNVLIYLSKRLQDHLLNIFHYALNPGGLLHLGSSESVGDSQLFVPAIGERLYRRNNSVGSQAPRSMSIHMTPNLANSKDFQAVERRSQVKSRKQLLQEQLLRSFAPTSILVDDGNRILETFGRSQDFLQLGEGSADLVVTRMIRQEMRSELHSLLTRIRRDEHDELESRIVFQLQDLGTFRFTVFKLESLGNQLVLICINPEKERPQPEPRMDRIQSDGVGSEEYLSYLQEELSSAREQLQTVIDEYDLSQQELQALNEEMQASGEELQATNEELATSNEELQATNEELTTVNDELNQKTSELSEVNTDLENIQNATSTALLLLNQDLLIRNFNSAAVRVLGLTKGDIGRNFTSLPIRLPVSEMVESCKRALRGAQQNPLEITSGDYYYQVEVRPYEKLSGEVNGIVVSINDVSEFRRQERMLKTTSDLFNIFTRNLDAAVWIQEPNFGRMLYLNQAFRDIYGLPVELVLRDPSYMFKVMSEEDTNALVEMHLGHTREPWYFHYSILHPTTGKRRMLTTRAFPVRENNKLQYVVGFTYDDTRDLSKKVFGEDAMKLISSLLQSNPEPVLGVDKELRVSFANPQILRLLGLQADDIEGQPVEQVLNSQELAELKQVVESGSDESKRFTRGNEDSNVNEVVLTGCNLLGQEQLAAFVTMHEEQGHSLQKRRLEIQANAFRSTREGIVILDHETRVIAVNPAYLRMMDVDEDEIIDKLLDIFPRRVEGCAFSDEIRQQLQAADLWSGEIHHANHADDFKVLEAEVRRLNQYSSYDEAAYMVMLSDITERRTFEKTIYRQANYDALTELPNRALLLDRLSQEIRHASRERNSITVMFIDLDRFKEVNDSMGHEAGDLLLLQVAKRVQGLIRKSDTFSRFGGDEFVLLMPKYYRHHAPEVFARKLLDELERPFNVLGQELFISASIGIAVYPEDGNDASELLANADAAMYEVKNSGRKGFAYHRKDMNVEARRRLVLERELREALDEKRLSMHYQPIVEATTGRPVTCEALMRWHHPELGVLPPADFIPYAEESGLINPVTRMAMQTVMRDLKHWRASHMPDFQVAINLSASCLAKETLAEWFEGSDLSYRDEHGELNLRGLVCEVTESIFLAIRSNKALSNLHWLRDHGATIALDDFGTGYSALSYLRNFPIDVIKIDKSFIAEAVNSDVDRALIKATVEMARGIGARLVAEGIENKAQCELLEQLGVDYLQGFYFSRPMPAEEFNLYLLESRSS